jgi:hypothetical protein
MAGIRYGMASVVNVGNTSTSLGSITAFFACWPQLVRAAMHREATNKRVIFLILMIFYVIFNSILSLQRKQYIPNKKNGG